MKQKILNGILLDEDCELSLNELCHVCSRPAEWIIGLVDEGALEPVGQQQSQWRFPASSLQKAHTAMRLQHDLGINLSGIALALDLLDEIRLLQARLCQFEGRHHE